MSHLVWLYVYRRWPEAEIDHCNVNTLDNRVNNLREATRSQNKANRRVLKTNRTGLKGVEDTGRLSAAKRYRARIMVNGKTTNLGYFTTPELAHVAYAKAAVKYFGEFARSA